MLGQDGTHYTDGRLRSARRGGLRLRAAPARGSLLSSLCRGRPRARPPRSTARLRPARCEVPECVRRLGPAHSPSPRTPAIGSRSRRRSSAPCRLARRAAATAGTAASPDHLPGDPPGYTLEKLALGNGVDGEFTAATSSRTAAQGPLPAILWLHSSTPDKTQVIIPGTNGGPEVAGRGLLKAGYAVLAPDAYWHGDRAGTGSVGGVGIGPGRAGRPVQAQPVARPTLWGMFVRDDQVALDYLCGRPEVTPRASAPPG